MISGNCIKCGHSFQGHWLKDGVCFGCREATIVTSEPYQGWTNAKTWCVALAIKRVIQEAHVKDGVDLSIKLCVLAADHDKRIKAVAPWAWGRYKVATDPDVNWDELAKHYKEGMK